jgi:hypothetical protein
MFTAGTGITCETTADGTVTISNTVSGASTATSSATGLIKIEDDTDQSVAAEAVSTTANRTYGLQLNSSDQGVVNVPWTDTNTTYSAGNFKLDDLGTPDDNTDLDFSTSRHGLVPKGTNTGNFLKDDGTWATAGAIGQVLQAVVTATIDITSTTFVDVSGITVDITPATTSSKILVMCDTHTSVSEGTRYCLKLVRDSTDIYVGDAAGNRSRSSAGGGSDENNDIDIWGNTSIYLDSPATTSATTYKLQAKTQADSLYFNRAQGDGNLARQPRTACSITVMEILA